ncbi:MAG: DUF2141 domain-containing protein [Sphingomonas bacterium]|nr:DUF2141 domain-containing protein [Sphingomonas bacterium]
MDFMRKSRFPLVAGATVAVLGLSTPAGSAIVGADAAVCAAGKPALLVRVNGLKRPTGTLKLSVYGNNPSVYLKKQGRLRRIKVPVTSRGPVDVCVAVPTSGRYAVAVHHDLNGNGNKDRHDGGGYSNNPRVSLMNMRPPFARTAVSVGQSPARVDVRLLYVSGLSVGPA